MKTRLVAGTVAAVHCLVVGIVLMQGCGTIRPAGAPPSAPDLGSVPMPSEEPVKMEAPVLEQPPAPEPEKRAFGPTTEYVVRKGDSLSAIARTYKLNLTELIAINGITNPNKIKQGQVLILPGEVKIQPPKKAVKKPAAAREGRGQSVVPTGSGGEYIVKPGDTLSEIASGHGTTVAAIKEANSLTSDMIRVKQKLMIPGAGAERPAADGAPAISAEPVAVDVAPLPVTGQGLAPVEGSGASGTAGVPVGDASFDFYQVREGDDLDRIAKDWLTDKEQIKQLNSMTSDEVKAGDVLKIPLTR